MKELDLGKEKISKLIKKFAIPCVISMIVAALYNIWWKSKRSRVLSIC